MKLLVRQIGNDEYPRYSIMCENHTWWTGEEWSPEKAKALRYASLPAVKNDWKLLQSQMARSSDEVIELEGQIVVSVSKKLTEEQLIALMWYLADASQLFLDYSHPRPEGLEGLCISTQIHWDTLREKERNSE